MNLVSSNSLLAAAGAIALAALPLAAAPAPGHQAHAQTPAPPPAKHMLFKVYGKSGQTVYLLGSVHLLTADAAQLPSEVDSAFSRAETIAFEVNTDSAKAHAMELMVRGRNAAGVTLRSELSASGAARADTVLHAYGLSVDALGGFKPWLVSVMLSQLALQKNNFQAQFGVDMQIDAKAHSAGKHIIGLEPVQSQIAMFDELSSADQEKMLITSHTPDSASVALEQIKNAWVAGNVVALDSLLNKGMADVPTLFARMVTDRNKQWIPKIEELINGSCSALIVVGSGHLVGSDGVIALLRAKGYTVDQM